MTTTTVTTPAAPADRSPATTGSRTRAGGTGGGSTSTRMRPGAHEENRIGWGFAAPFTILFVLFLVWPLLHGLYLSFTGQSLTGQGGELIGVANYAEAAEYLNYDPPAWFTGSGSDFQTYFLDSIQSVILAKDDAATGMKRFVDRVNTQLGRPAPV